MKTIIAIEIETPDTLPVWEDADKSEEDYSEEELKKYRETYCRELHQEVIKEFTDIDRIEERFIENLEELSIEDWDSFKDYGVKIKIR